MYIHTYIHTCIYIYICIYTQFVISNVFVYVYIYIYIERERDSALHLICNVRCIYIARRLGAIRGLVGLRVGRQVGPGLGCRVGVVRIIIRRHITVLL